MGILLLIAILLTFYASLRLQGLFSFTTLGVIGAAIYSVPGLIGLELPFYAVAVRAAVLLPTLFEADLMMLVAWAGMLIGIVAFPKRKQRSGWDPSHNEQMLNLAIASAILAALGWLYLGWTEGWLFFLASRYDQSTSWLTLLWRWTPVTGLIAALLCRNRPLIAFCALVVFIIFLRGDRTMVAVTAASMIVTFAHVGGGLASFLAPRRLIPVIFLAVGVLFGKSLYYSLKSVLSGEGWVASDVPLESQLIGQFEPLVTYAHLGHAIALELSLPLIEFLTSVLGNLLLFPSVFGVRTNLYNLVVTATLPASIRFGVAGNYAAHGWMVAGAFGVFVFYLLLAAMLRLCDQQFSRRMGAAKLFWACAGGTIAFYVHRNGMDNLFSFVRQNLIVCIAIFALAWCLKVLRPAAAPGLLAHSGAGWPLQQGPQTPAWRSVQTHARATSQTPT